MSTTFANQINNLDIYAARAVADKDGNQLDTTYAKSSDLATVATTGDYADLSNKPTIPAALSAGDGIDISSNVVSAKIDGSSLSNGASGLSVTLPVPSTTGASQGDVLSIGTNGIEWSTPSSNSDVFLATYGTTTFTEIKDAHDAGKAVFLYKPSTFAEKGYLLPLTLIFISNVDENTYAWFTYMAMYYQGNVATGYVYEINKANGWSTRTNSAITPPTSADVGKVFRATSQGHAAWSTINEVPTSTSSDADKVLTVDSNGDAVWVSPSYGLFEAIYGQTSYSDIVAAINAHKIVYCRISATGASRMAFLAYIGTSNVEFQYYRSLNSHSASNQTDEVYVYTVSSSGWTTTTRLAGIKYAAGTHMTSSFADNTLTFQSVWPTVDQTYDGTSTNAQSGTAVAGALAAKEETSLYESDTAVAQGDTFSLSETPANFKTIKIYIAHGANATNWATVLEYPGDVTRYDIILPATDNATNMIIDRFYFSRSGTTVTVGARKRHTIGASSVSSTDLTNPAFIMKVVGIDRISGGN